LLFRRRTHTHAYEDKTKILKGNVLHRVLYSQAHEMDSKKKMQVIRVGRVFYFGAASHVDRNVAYRQLRHHDKQRLAVCFHIPTSRV